MATNQDYTEDMAQGDFSNESYGDFQQSENVEAKEHAGEQNGNEAMDETSNVDANEPSSPDPSAKDEDRKLFVGGLSWATTDKELREHFGKYGEIESVTVKIDPQTGRSRGFAFLVFKSPETLDKVMNSGEHVINGKRVDPKKAKARSGKIFVGGLPQDTTEETIRSFFGTFGNIVEIEMPFDRVKNQRKNFCFITYDNENVVFDLLKTPKQVINGKEVDVKKATPKPENFGPPAMRGGRGGPGGMRGAPRGRGWGGPGGYPAGYSYNNSGYGSGYGGYGGYGDGYGYDYYGGGYDSYGNYGDYGYGGYGGYGGQPQAYSGGKQRGAGRQAPRHQPY